MIPELTCRTFSNRFLKLNVFFVISAASPWCTASRSRTVTRRTDGRVPVREPPFPSTTTTTRLGHRACRLRCFSSISPTARVGSEARWRFGVDPRHPTFEVHGPRGRSARDTTVLRQVTWTHYKQVWQSQLLLLVKHYGSAISRKLDDRQTLSLKIFKESDHHKHEFLCQPVKNQLEPCDLVYHINKTV